MNRKIVYELPKLCVPVMVKNIAEAKALDEKTGGYEACDVIEIRVDYLENINDELEEVVTILSNKFESKEIILTYRTVPEGGLGEYSYDSYRELLIRLCNLRCNYVDVEVNRGAAVIDEIAAFAHRKSVSVIGSYHNFEHTPAIKDLAYISAIISDSRADIIKIAVMPKNKEDVYNLLRFTAKTRRVTSKKLITMSMGEMGRCSRVFGFLCGSYLTFVTVSEASAPGQIGIFDCKNMLNKILGLKFSLIGFMGSGKSTVSAALAEILPYPLIDTDEYIVQSERMSINEIFATKGEDYFRDVEEETLKELLDSATVSIISCGGGIIKRESNRRALKEKSCNIWLNASPQTVLERVKGDDSRPLLKGKMNVSDISDMISQRRPMYEDTYSLKVDTDGLGPKEIVINIFDKVIS